MTQSGTLYRFYSKSQHILNVSLRGRKFKVKFSTPYNGLARYSTNDECIARQIRKSFPFLNGMIKEESPITSNAATIKQETVAFSEKKGNTGKADWMNRSVMVKKRASESNNNPIADATAAKAPAPAPAAVVAPTGDDAENKKTADPESEATNNPIADATAAKAPETTTEQADGKAVQGEMFGIKLEEVESYMEAKEYVRDVLGADVTRKEEVKEYCATHNIVFPKFSFD